MMRGPLRVSLLASASAVLPLLMAAPFGADAAAQALVPAGYRLGDPVNLPDSLIEGYGARFSIAVTRPAQNDFERELIRRAERLIPAASRIEAATDSFVANRRTPGAWPAAFRAAAEAPGERWWWRDWDHVWLPYALTGSAVAHYVARVRELSGQPNPFRRPGEDFDHTARFEYSAAVLSSPDGRYTVRLSARWSFHCGSLCGLWFSHDREVVFDSDGNVVSVAGDRPPNYMVS